LHRNVRFSPSSRSCLKTRLNDHTTALHWRQHDVFCFDGTCGGATLVAGVARLGVFSATY